MKYFSAKIKPFTKPKWSTGIIINNIKLYYFNNENLLKNVNIQG